MSLVRSILDSGCKVGMVTIYYDVHTKIFERVQKKFLRYFNYRFPNIELNFRLLKDRTQILDSKFFDKLFNGGVDGNKLLSLINLHCNRRLRSNRIF